MTTRKHQRPQATQNENIVLKAIIYSFVWVLVWGAVAIGVALGSLIIIAVIASQSDVTARDTGNILLTILLVVTVLAFLTVWLLCKGKSLFMRTSWIILLIYTCVGLFIVGQMILINNINIGPLQQSIQRETPDTTAPKEDVEDEPRQASPLPTRNSTTTRPTQTQPTYTTPRAGCLHQNDIPYSIVEKTDSSLKEGQTREILGYNGTRKVCTNEKGEVVSVETITTPINKIIYRGTFTYEQARSKAMGICNTSLPAGTPRYSTFFWNCVGRELDKIW